MEVTGTVTCPDCNRQWTGHFEADKLPDKVRCRDCKEERIKKQDDKE